jgi:thiamine-phosphate pyrophosphorylase
MHDVSPAIERAWIAASRRAGGNPVRLSDLLLALLEEEEGRPAGLLENLGFQLEHVRDAIAGHGQHAPYAPTPETMLQAARDYSLQLRAEPSPTTEFLFLAAMGHDREFAIAFGELGLTLERIQHALMSDDLITATADENNVEFHIQEPAENVAAMRVVDANLNRSREAFRVLDDYCRFVLNDTALTERWKLLRHRLAEASGLLSRNGLLAARDTLRDVGTGIQTESEFGSRIGAFKRFFQCRRGKVQSSHVASKLDPRDCRSHRSWENKFGASVDRHQL